MNRAWIPAGALASVSVAGLIALGPLTDSLQHAGVVPVRRDGVRSRPGEAASFPSAYPGGRGRQDQRTPLSTRRGGAARARQRTATSARSPCEGLEEARLRCRRPRRRRGRPTPAAAGKEEDHQAAPDLDRRQQRVERRRGPRVRRQGSGSGGVGEQSCQPGSDSNSLRPAGSPGRVGRIRALGAIAQLGERLDRTQEVSGSSPLSSITVHAGCRPYGLCIRWSWHRDWYRS